MKGFTLQLQAARSSERIENVLAFAGTDTSGSFSLLAGHERMITELVFGLARFRDSTSAWQYIAVPGALLYFRDNVLTLCSRRFIRSDDHKRIVEILRQEFEAEEVSVQKTRGNLRRMEEALLKRLYELGVRSA